MEQGLHTGCIKPEQKDRCGPSFRRPFSKAPMLIPAARFYNGKKTPWGKSLFDRNEKVPLRFSQAFGWRQILIPKSGWGRTCVISPATKELVASIHTRCLSFCRRKPVLGFQESPGRNLATVFPANKCRDHRSPNGSINQKNNVPRASKR